MIDDPLSLLSLGIWLMAAGMYPLGLMLGSECLGCCCDECCWKVDSFGGCPGPTATLSDDGLEILLCFQDSGNCGTQSCDSLNLGQAETAECEASTPCTATQGIRLSTFLSVRDAVTLTVSLEGLVETVDPGYDETTVTLEGIGSVNIGSGMGETGGGTCAMNFVQKSEEFEVPAGCLEIIIESTTRDGLWHFGMYSKITLSFSDATKVAECAASLCTDFVCTDGSCIAEGTGGGVSKDLNQCVEECSQEECTTVGFYCCVEGAGSTPRRCRPRSWRVCETSDAGFVGKSKSSDEKKSGGILGDDGLFVLADPVVLPAGAFETLGECRDNCPPAGYECVNNVCEESGEDDPTYETLEECEQECLGAFDCNQFGECIQTGDENSPYQNRQDCEQNCQHGYACAANGVCYRVANGPYATKELCEAECEPNIAGKYFCVSSNGVVGCKKGPLDEGDTILSGPHNGIVDCQFWCRKHSCVDECGLDCVPADNGEFQTLASCLQTCGDPAVEPCTLATTQGTEPGTFLFNIDGASRDVCISYLSIKGQPIQVQGVYLIRNPVTCTVSGVARANSGWRGYPECDCRDVRPPGPLRGGPKGFVSFRKPKGITSFYVVVLAPCPNTEVQWTVRCEAGPCEEAEDDEPLGACCVDGECSDEVTEADCLAVGGKWIGPCTECQDEGVQCDPRGACCYPDGSCLQKTEASCLAEGGAYQGDDVACFQVFCPQPDRGACCFREGCAPNVTQEQCEIFGGVYLGDGTTCGPVDPCAGACCVSNTCLETPSEADCVDLLGGQWQGQNSKCEEVECPEGCESDEDCPEGQCCYEGECSPCGDCSACPPTGQGITIAIGPHLYELPLTSLRTYGPAPRCGSGYSASWLGGGNNWSTSGLFLDNCSQLPLRTFNDFPWHSEARCVADDFADAFCIEGVIHVIITRTLGCFGEPTAPNTWPLECQTTQTWDFMFTQYDSGGCATGSATIVSDLLDEIGDNCEGCDPAGTDCTTLDGWSDVPTVQIGNPFP